MFKILIKYEWKLFVRNRFQLLFLAIFLLVSAYAIYYGRSEIKTQKENIEVVKTLEKEGFEKYIASFGKEPETRKEEELKDIACKPSYAWYRHEYSASLPPHDYAALAIGQRDLYRYYFSLTGMSLYYQLFENELANPVNLLVGNFDLLFVLIYLFPLLIITSVYSLYAAEKEGGTLPLLRMQTISVRKITTLRFSFHFVLITGIALLITFGGMLVCGNPLSNYNYLSTIYWLLGVTFYSFFWYGLLYLIISFKKNSAFNAIVSISCWLLLLVIIPSLLNIVVTTKYPINSASLSEITRRTGLENDDDKEEANAVLKEFFEHNKTYAVTDSLIDTNFMAKTYAAFTWLKDAHSKQMVDKFNNQLSKREQWIHHLDWLNPATNIQKSFTETSKTDWNTLIQFQRSLSPFHNQITHFYYSKLFWNKPLTLENYKQRPTYTWVDNNVNRWLNIRERLSKIVLFGGILFVIGFIKFKKI
ncbi:DUF3526 domain-containing protein [Pseudofulvibacter geojedonensis]|uniref:DUF3526 domain-containing protein n=1 Tax=Pseudofulvibacter geojedonensis TaxID=1123758 RepID=A0ABW3I2I6_9FLAO